MADNRTLAKGAMIGGAPVYYTEESTTGTTMPNTSYFKTEDVDGKPVKISRDNIMGIVKECLGTILNGGSDQTTVTKVPTLNGNTLGASAVSTLASVLGVNQCLRTTITGQIKTDDDPIPENVGWYVVALSNSQSTSWRGLSKGSSFCLIAKGDRPILLGHDYITKKLKFYDLETSAFVGVTA